MIGRRCQFVYNNVTVFADRVRLGFLNYPESARYCLTITPEDPEASELDQAPISIDLPINARRAYERAAAAFNAVLDEHERDEAKRLERRRVRDRRRKTAASPITPRTEGGDHASCANA